MKTFLGLVGSFVVGACVTLSAVTYCPFVHKMVHKSCAVKCCCEGCCQGKDCDCVDCKCCHCCKGHKKCVKRGCCK